MGPADDLRSRSGGVSLVGDSRGCRDRRTRQPVDRTAGYRPIDSGYTRIISGKAIDTYHLAVH